MVIPEPSSALNSESYNSIIIQNIQGEIIKTLPFSDEVDISDLASGIYFLKIGSNNKKFIKP
jgi:hypothetical protein